MEANFKPERLVQAPSSSAFSATLQPGHQSKSIQQKPPKFPGNVGYEALKIDTLNLKSSFSNSRQPAGIYNYQYNNHRSQKNLNQNSNLQQPVDSEWQRLFAHMPLTPSTHQMNAETNYNFKNPRAQSTSQGFMQARSASVGSKNPSALNVGMTFGLRETHKKGKKKYIGEEKDLQNAILSVQSYATGGGQSREESVTTPMSPSQTAMKAPQLLQMVRGKSKQEFTFGFQKDQLQFQSSHTNGLFSPSTREGSAMRVNKIGRSRSKSPQSGDEVGSQQNRIQQEMQDLQLQTEIAEQVKVNKLLTLNNYSKMLQNVEKVKKDLYHDHKILQNVKLVSTLQHNMQQEVFKVRGQNNYRVLNEFVNATDKVIKSLIPSQDAWKIKNHVIKNLQVKIHTSELVNTMRSSKNKGLNQVKLNDVVQDSSTAGISGQHSRSRSPPSHAGRQRPRTQMQNQKVTPLSSGMQDSYQDSDTSYLAYVDALTRRANMQQMISQNIIKVKFIKEEERLNELKKTEAEMNLMKQNASIDSLEEIVSLKKDIMDDTLYPQEQQGLDEEKLIKDYISERDMFIQRHKRKKRIIFNQESSQEQQSKIDVVEISQIALKDFIKKNKINPKIFTFDRSLDEYRPQMNKRIYYLQKSVMLLQTQKIGQARIFLINAVKEFPTDFPLIFNKGLMHYLNSEYTEGARIFYHLLSKLKSKNLLLINLCLCHLQSHEYEEVLGLQSEIEKKDNYLDFNEKQLRMMGLFAREKLKADEPQRYEKYMKIQKDKERRNEWENNVKTRISTPVSQIRSQKSKKDALKVVVQRAATPVQGNRYRDAEDKDIIIKDENKVPITDDIIKDSILTDIHHLQEGVNEPFSSILRQHQQQMNQPQRTHTDRNQGMKVQFSQQFSEVFTNSLQQSSDDDGGSTGKKKKSIKQKVTTSGGLLIEDPPQLEMGKVYEIDDQAGDTSMGEVLTKEDQNILADIMFLRQDFESENKLIEFIQKIEKRKQGSTKVFLDKRDEFFMKKYKRGVNALLERNTKYFYKKYLQPEDENDKYTRKVNKVIKPNSKKLLQKSGSDLENEEVKLMQLLGMTQEKIDERILKYNLAQGLKNAFTKNPSQTQVDKPSQEQEKEEFAPKTMDFIQLIFREFGLKEIMIPGAENTSIIQDIRNIETFNAYINKLSEFMTTKTACFSDERQRMQAEEEQQAKNVEQKKKKLKGYDSDNDEGMQMINFDKKDDDDPDKEENQKNMIEVFQNVLEIKYIDMFGDQNYEDAAFYQQLLQKLNAIDLLQIFLKNAAKKILSGERLLTFKKELSMGMLQIFREEICKKELNYIKANDSKFEIQKVNYDMIDRTLRKLRFFKNFAQNIRLRLYEVCRYELVPPGRIIAHQEELESHIFVIISGIASLTVKYLESNESYSGMLIYPGDAVGDANIKDKIVISKGRGETKWYVSSVKECDVLVFERRQFTDVLFKDMMDSLYEKIMCMRNSEFFENLSPYAMVILCSNIELHEYSYGDVILRQNTEPEECFIIISGECKLVLETVIYKPQEERTAKTGSYKMKFGQQNYNPSDKYGKTNSKTKKDKAAVDGGTAEKGLINQKKLNEKFSFQNEVLDFQSTPEQNNFDMVGSDRGSQSPVYRAPVINSTDIPFSEQKQGTKMIAYRHHLPYDKVVSGKVLCSRALLEKEYIKKFINKKYDQFKEQLYGRDHNRSSSQSSNNSDRVLSPISRKDNEDQILSFAGSHVGSPKNSTIIQDNFMTTSKPQSKQLGRVGGSKTPTNRLNSAVNFKSDFGSNGGGAGLSNEEEKQAEIDKIYHAVMKSQLTVIADQAVVKVLKLTRKSKKYLSDPLKNMIDNRIYETKFKDYDRPFKNEAEVQKFIDGQRKWEQYKDKVNKNIVQKYVFK